MGRPWHLIQIEYITLVDHVLRTELRRGYSYVTVRMKDIKVFKLTLKSFKILCLQL